jgi:hypothetical protein
VTEKAAEPAASISFKLEPLQIKEEDLLKFFQDYLKKIDFT